MYRAKLCPEVERCSRIFNELKTERGGLGKQTVVTRAEQKSFDVYNSRLKIYHVITFTISHPELGFIGFRHFCWTVIVWQNGYSVREQLAREVNRFEQNLFASAGCADGCRHKSANHVCPFDSVVLMADCWWLDLETMSVPIVLMAPRTERGSGGIPMKP